MTPKYVSALTSHLNSSSQYLMAYQTCQRNTSKWKLLIFPLNLFLPQPSLIFINSNFILPVAQRERLGVSLTSLLLLLHLSSGQEMPLVLPSKYIQFSPFSQLLPSRTDHHYACLDYYTTFTSIGLLFRFNSCPRPLTPNAKSPYWLATSHFKTAKSLIILLFKNSPNGSSLPHLISTITKLSCILASYITRKSGRVPTSLPGQPKNKKFRKTTEFFVY